MDENNFLVSGTEMNYDPWGRHRNPNTWDYLDQSPLVDGTILAWMDRGYTGHEHVDEFSLINMNGRFYDPALGRMLSPDNFVQNPYNSQSYNRYSYVRNNPLKYIDPSGEFISVPFIVYAAISKAIYSTVANGVSYILNNAGQGTWDGGEFVGGLVESFFTGFLEGAIQNLSL